jgi:hypothetical protein
LPLFLSVKIKIGLRQEINTPALTRTHKAQTPDPKPIKLKQVIPIAPTLVILDLSTLILSR